MGIKLSACHGSRKTQVQPFVRGSSNKDESKELIMKKLLLAGWD
jgi:hypothetical protein